MISSVRIEKHPQNLQPTELVAAAFGVALRAWTAAGGRPLTPRRFRGAIAHSLDEPDRLFYALLRLGLLVPNRVGLLHPNLPPRARAALKTRSRGARPAVLAVGPTLYVYLHGAAGLHGAGAAVIGEPPHDVIHNPPPDLPARPVVAVITLNEEVLHALFG